MHSWSPEINSEFTSLIKEWLKNQGRTQAELGKSLKADSSRMYALLEVLEKEHKKGGLPKVAEKLCQIESEWTNHKQKSAPQEEKDFDPFAQLDLILQEMKEDFSKKDISENSI